MYEYHEWKDGVIAINLNWEINSNLIQKAQELINQIKSNQFK